MTVTTFLLGMAAWFAVGIVVSLAFGRIVRARDLQVPLSAEIRGAWTAWDDEWSSLVANGRR